MKRSVVGMGVVAVLLLLSLFSEIVRTLIFGWISFLTRNVPQARVNPDAILTGAIVLGLFVVMIHAFGVWCCRGASRRWHVRWTLSIVVVLVLMFVSGYSAMGIARQLGWILSSPEPW